MASGWGALADRAALVEVDDTTVAARWRRGLLATVMDAGSPDLDAVAVAAGSLDVAGLPDEAERARVLDLFAHVPHGLHVDGLLVGEVARHDERHLGVGVGVG